MNKTALLTACTLGALIGAATYFTHQAPVVQPADSFVEEQSVVYANADAMYWARHTAQFNVAQYEKLACRKLYGEHYKPDGAGNCEPPVDCTSCITSKGVARNAVIHDNAWVRTKAKGSDYDAMMRQAKLVFQMSMARQGEIEAGRRAYDHTVRCQRIWAGADIQCKK